MKNGKVCFGVIIGTRAYFNSALAKDVKKQLTLTAIFSILLGLVLVIWPDAAKMAVSYLIGAALVICPPAPLDVGAVEHDGAKLRAVYRLGRAVGAEQLSAVQDFLRRAKEAAE